MDTLYPAIQLVSLALFLVLFLGRAVYLKRTRGINILTVGRGKKGLPWLAELLFAPFLLLWLTEVVLYALGSPFRIFPAPLDLQIIAGQSLQVAGVFCFAAALALFLAALIAFGTSWRVGIDENKPGELVIHGIFALSRNPIFVCLDLYVLGAFLVHGTLIFLLVAVVMAIGVHYQIIQEERFLHRRYGTAYSDYCQRTGRYFGWRASRSVSLEGSI